MNFDDTSEVMHPIHHHLVCHCHCCSVSMNRLHVQYQSLAIDRSELGIVKVIEKKRCLLYLPEFDHHDFLHHHHRWPDF